MASYFRASAADNSVPVTTFEIGKISEPAEATHPELGVNPYQDPPTRSSDGLLLDRSHRRIRRGQAPFPRYAVRTQERHIDDHLTEHPQCPMVHCGLGAASHPAT